MTATATSSAELLRSLYRTMLTIRRFEELALDLRTQDVAQGSMHLCAGQEAVPAGALSVLGADDRVASTYRGHGWAIACGVPLDALLAEICQRATGINGGRGGSAYLTAPQYRFVGENSIVGGGVPIAAGVALALKRLDRPRAKAAAPRRRRGRLHRRRRDEPGRHARRGRDGRRAAPSGRVRLREQRL